jgi:acetyl esterase/lipase
MPLDPQAQAFLEQLAAAGDPPLHELSVAEARQVIVALFGTQGDPEPVGAVEERTIPGADGEMPTRIYIPYGTGPFPVLVYFHGGGWVIGDLVAYDATCRALTNAAGCLVVAMEYRLAPEHKFPAAPEDCYAAICWVAANAVAIGGDPRRIAIGGDSAGGNLTAVVAQMARDRGGPALVYQLLVYPVTNYGYDTASYRENAEGYLLTKDAMVWFWNYYLRSATDGNNPLASPLQANDLHGLQWRWYSQPSLIHCAMKAKRMLSDSRKRESPLHSSAMPGQFTGFSAWARCSIRASRPWRTLLPRCVPSLPNKAIVRSVL